MGGVLVCAICYAKPMRQLKRIALLNIKKAYYALRQPSYKPVFIHKNIPYFSQWESQELVEKIITKEIEAKDDPRWRESGARDTREYTEWSWSCCGMACLKMILAHKQHKIIPLVYLGKQCLKYGGYRMPVQTSPGLFYKPFLRFIKDEYGLDGSTSSALTLAEIKKTVSQGGYAIVSVTPEIRFPLKEPTRRGGHLVLVYGYDDQREVLYLNNPSGFASSQEAVSILYKQFFRFFDHKGILITA